uniref:Uncharacterized protein n=1 Tax=Zea mays TaxID=4577 RepID=A0A804NLL3_MAIZE
MPPRPAATAPASVSRNRRSLPRYASIHACAVASAISPRPILISPAIPAVSLRSASATSSALDRHARLSPCRHQGGAQSTSAAAAAPGRRSTSAIRSLFSWPLAAAGGAPSGFGVAALPDFCRCKSFSCGREGDALAAAGKPQRRSCDVRGRSTLWALFQQDDRQPVRDGTAFGAFPASSSVAAHRGRARRQGPLAPAASAAATSRVRP